ncbi:MAG: hypothetical protein K9J12_15070 [Melioribacteraceae bacterium]|nr:hypothetical protein [Melioribacteraceae bacterium]MCF8264746.1 hypothetical protein [Melioribacteraceae bacterium]
MKLLKTFPIDFLPECDVSLIDLPGKQLVFGSELFGSYELTDVEGNPALQVDSYEKAKYILYANRTRPKEIKMPELPENVVTTIKAYEKHLDELVRAIVKDYKSHFPQSARFHEVSNQIFTALNLNRF